MDKIEHIEEEQRFEENRTEESRGVKIGIKRVRKRRQERRTSNERREDSETEVKDRKAKQAVSLRSGGESQCSHMEPRTRSTLPTADHQTPRILLVHYSARGS